MTHYLLETRVRVHWFSEEVTDLNRAREGSYTAPLTAAVRLTSTACRDCERHELDIQVNEFSAEFVDSLRAALSGPSLLIECGLTELLEQLRSALPAAIEHHLRDRYAVTQTPFTEPAVIPMYLPFLDRREWRARGPKLAGMQLHAEGGALFGTGTGQRTGFFGTLGLTREIGTPLQIIRDDQPLSFHFAATLTPERLTRFQDAICAYDFGSKMDRYLLTIDRPVDVQFSVTLPGRSIRAWRTTPAEESTAFPRTFVPVSHAVQRTLRNWLPLLALQSAAHYADVKLGPSVLTYGLTRAYHGRCKSQLSYDLMETDSMRSAYWSANRALPLALSKVHTLLKTSGFGTEAQYYAPTRLQNFLDLVKKDRRLFPSLLRLDALITDDLIAYAENARSVHQISSGDPQKALLLAVREGQEFGKRFRRRVNALLPHAELAGLSTLLLLEATAVLAPAEPRRATLTVDGATFLSANVSPQVKWRSVA